jgi:poly(ribitol-phosphate) beta-N-acetylglucosaminyltransferase
MSYKISCIVPIYNMERYIHDMVNSLKNQSIGFNNIELILVDDKSNDSSREIIKNLEKKFNNIKGILLEENSGGPSEPKNIGVSHATGEYLIFLDPDDCVPKDAYEKLYRLAKETNDDFVMGNIKKFNEKKTWIQPQMNITLLQRSHISININDKPEFLSILGYMVTKLIKREFFIKHKFKFDKSINLGEDYLLGVEIFNKAKKFSYIPEFVYLYREIEEQSLTKMNSKRAIENFIKVINEIDEKTKLDRNSEYVYINIIKSIIYRFNEEFLDLEYDEKINILLMSRSIFESFECTDIKYFSNHELGIINLYKSKKYDLLLRFINEKVVRDISYNSYIELKNKLTKNKEQINNIIWKETKGLRKKLYTLKKELNLKNK